MVEEAQDPASQDRQAVAAVREGDAGRYRELVERHERRVYAVAWSRLGDAAMAEEATQEAFVRGYRHLALLGDGAKFSAWIGTIVRNAAISLGLRQRRELNKRARWALEQPVATEPVEDATEMAQTSETLRQALADLPAAHRECLVLFYLEGKSGAEAAAALGISETALRVRLHRARGELRERMEARLGESLAQLRPGRTLVPSVMAVVMSGSTAKIGGGAGVGASLAAALGKVLPFKLAAMFIPVAGMAPALGFSWWLNREERRNYREAEGFRAKLHRKIFRRGWHWVGLMAIYGVVFLAMHWGIHLIGSQRALLIMGLLMLGLLGLSARQFVINRNQYQWGTFLYILVITTGVLAMGLGWLWEGLMFGVMLAGFLVMLPVLGLRPLRMDYNLFLRAMQGLLKDAAANIDAVKTASRMDRPELLAFARFLGERYLAVNYRWVEDGLMLCLPTVANAPLNGFASVSYFRWSKCSWIVLSWDGAVRAHCGPRDERALRGLGDPNISSEADLAVRVMSSVGRAWRSFRIGDWAFAERVLGQVADAEVFVVPPPRSIAVRWWQWLFLGVVIVMLLQGLFQYFYFSGPPTPESVRPHVVLHPPGSGSAAR
jgi:RNA polymerase sigma-70 factor (ECF subfamily)